MDKVYTVSQINKYVKMLFDKDVFLNNITLTGEITNFKAHYTGHFYFTLKDDTSTIKCVMFKSAASLVKFKPQDGMKVVITGQVSVFERDGAYQIYCRTMKPEGLGDLYLAYEQLKKKLELEGLFKQEYKKKIPFLPNRVGIITSKTGAVIRDIINVSTRRYDKVNLLVYPAAVQGVNVSSTVISGIKTFNKLQNVDVIIIARGGGSFEDLFGFNDEALAREIFASKIPIVSAVGHETDFTICDFVSDLRAPTPSAAAELAVPNVQELEMKLKVFENRFQNALQKKVELMRLRYEKCMKASAFTNPLQKVNENYILIDKQIKRLESSISLKLKEKKTYMIEWITKLDTLSPLKTLTRGYSIVSSKGKIINSAESLKQGDKIDLHFIDGEKQAEII